MALKRQSWDQNPSIFDSKICVPDHRALLLSYTENKDGWNIRTANVASFSLLCINYFIKHC